MSDYTPTEIGVRLAYVDGLRESGFTREEHRAEFDRFIARVKAEALREASGDLRQRARNVSDGHAQIGVESAVDWLSRRANQIEKEAEL